MTSGRENESDTKEAKTKQNPKTVSSFKDLFKSF